MLDHLDNWNPFDLLYERDSSVTSRPDISFLSSRPLIPVVGVILIHPQPEYKKRDIHVMANEFIHRLVASRELVAVTIDTRLDTNGTGLQTVAEVESLIARMDVVLTTRLHGTVLALKNGVPAIAIDPVSGGAKIRRQAETIRWPFAFVGNELTDSQLHEAFDYCLTEGARVKARECRQRAVKMVEQVRDEFISAMARLIEVIRG